MARKKPVTTAQTGNPAQPALPGLALNPLADYVRGRATEILADTAEPPDGVEVDAERFLRSRLIPSPIPQYDHHYSHDPRRHLIRYVYHVERDRLFEDLFARLAKA